MNEVIVGPVAVELTPGEAELAARIDFFPDQRRLGADFFEVVKASSDAAGQLARSVLGRRAIPDIRLAYFTDPAYNIGSQKSREEVFASNGTAGEDILDHPHFLKYLRYFIYGPDLPDGVIAGFCSIVEEDRGSSGMVLDSLRAFARNEVRARGLDRHDAAEGFFTLALECGLDLSTARIVRDAGLSARSSRR